MIRAIALRRECRCRQGALDGPAQLVESMDQHLRHDACSPGPLGHNVSFSGEFDPSVPARVRHLHGFRGPSTVLFGVGAIIVDAVQLTSRWTTAHIAEKGRIVVQPCLRHGDPTTAIVLVGGIRAICAAKLRMLPHAIFTSFRRAVRFAMGAVGMHLPILPEGICYGWSCGFPF